jgi:phosphoserine phosphatase
MIENRKEIAFFLVERELLPISSGRIAFHFARNAQAFTERIYRLMAVGGTSLLRPFVSVVNPEIAARLLHLFLRGMSRDRLDLLGEEFFHYVLRPNLNLPGTEQIERLKRQGREIVLVSQELEHLIRPLADYLNVERLLANRLEFRDDLATGRLLDPVIPPPRVFFRKRVSGSTSQTKDSVDYPALISRDAIKASLSSVPMQRRVEDYVASASRAVRPRKRPAVNFESRQQAVPPFSVRQTLTGKNLLLVGSTGFIGKVWLNMLLQDLPGINKIYLLIRRQGSRSAVQRFERIVAESPVFKTLHERYGDRLAEYLGEKLEILEGDVSEPRFGLDERVVEYLYSQLDLVVNSAGLTDFNPDLRLALSTNADSVLHLVGFLRKCDRAGLIHVSTCFVSGRIDGRIPEESTPNYTPRGLPDFDARQEREFLLESMEQITAEAEGPELTQRFYRDATARHKAGDNPTSDERSIQNLVRKARIRWVREKLIELGIARARHWGWPNIYTYTKSLGESLLLLEGQGLPVAVVRPSIVESSISQPFRGWNEGVNTTAPLSYLLGTYFRQLPSNKRKRLDVIPVDYVCRGLTLISAAVVLRCHHRVYQLATSANNPADMRRAIELTCLAHRKHYRSLEGLEHWLRARFDTIPVSRARYRNVSLPRFQALLQGLQRVFSFLPSVGEAVTRKQRVLDRYQKVIELYEPFILDNEYFFAADHIRILSNALPEDEQSAFEYDTDGIDWYDYWINLHVPALRRWTYPLIEGRRPETGLLPRNFKLPVTSRKAINSPGLSEVSGGEGTGAMRDTRS